MSNLILTPETDPYFYATLYTSPLKANQISQFYVVRENSLLLENVSENEMLEYLDSGELEEVESYWDSLELEV